MKSITGRTSDFKGHDVVVYGDNHKGFLATQGNTTMFNCGGLQRRKSDEISYRPQVGLLYENGSIKPELLDCSADNIVKTSLAQSQKDGMNMGDFLTALDSIIDSYFNC